MNNNASENAYSVSKLTEEARRLAADYRRATGKTLPLSPEIAINDAIRLLDLAPSEDDSCDALHESDAGQQKVLVKGRTIFDKRKGTQRLGQLSLDKPWQIALLVLMDENYETTEIHLASREALDSALAQKPNNKRGTMTVNQFKVIGEKVWPDE